MYWLIPILIPTFVFAELKIEDSLPGGIFEKESPGFDLDHQIETFNKDALESNGPSVDEEIDEDLGDLGGNVTLLFSKDRIPHLSAKAARQRMMTMIRDRFPFLTQEERKALRFVMRKTSSHELNNAIAVFTRLCPDLIDCQLLPPLRFMDYSIQYSRPHQLAMCMIPKNMSTLMTAIMCYLHDKDRIKGLNKKRFYEQWGTNRTCKDNGAKSWRKVEQGVGRNRHSIRKLVLVRNPAERFLSAYEHLCTDAGYCLGCKDQACVIETLYHNAREYLMRGKAISTLPHPVYHFDVHFFPQSWRCDFQTMRRSYTLIHVTSKKQNKLADDMAEYFKWRGVSKEDVNYIHRHIANGRNEHSTVDKHRLMNKRDRSRLYHNKPILRKFLSIFFFDYLILGYPLPKVSMIR